MKTIELGNSFHGTSIRVRVPEVWADDPNGGAWLNIQQAADRARVSRRTLYNWLAAGKLRWWRTAGGSLRIVEASLWEQG